MSDLPCVNCTMEFPWDEAVEPFPDPQLCQSCWEMDSLRTKLAKAESELGKPGTMYEKLWARNETIDHLTDELADARKDIAGLERFRALRLRHNDEMERTHSLKLKAEEERDRARSERNGAHDEVIRLMNRTKQAVTIWDELSRAYGDDFHWPTEGKKAIRTALTEDTEGSVSTD